MTTKVPASMTVEALTASGQAAAILAGNIKLTGDVVQQVYASTGAVTTIATPPTIPLDDTIPQITEGTEVLTATITPTASSNYLEIEAVVNLAGNATSGYLVAALFQDATANALAANVATYTSAGFVYQVVIRCRITAGTTSATTLRLRVGPASGTTLQLTLNGTAGARLFGGAYLSSITVTEIKS